MPSPGRTATWGAEQWAAFVLEHLNAESVLLASGVRRINIVGKEAHVPRLLDDGTVVWVAEATEIPSDCPDADELVLAPKKVANICGLSNESISDSNVSVLNAVGDAMTRAVAKEVDKKALSADAATATSPAGLLSATLPGGAGPVDVATILGAIGVIGAAGGLANAVYINPADLTTIRQAIVAGGYSISDPTAPGAEAVGGARLYPTAAMTAGKALVAQADQIVVALRQDATVTFSPDAGFTSDSTLARVVARVDFGDQRSRWALRRRSGRGRHRRREQGQEVSQPVIVATMWTGPEVVGAVDQAAPPTEAELDAIAHRLTAENCAVRPVVRVVCEFVLPPYVDTGEPTCEEIHERWRLGAWRAV